MCKNLVGKVLSEGSGALQWSYRYDNIGNVLAITDTSQTTNFVYDPLDRLTGASGAYSASFDYNAIGNLLRKTEGGITYNLAYTLTRPIHAPGAVNGQAYTYDQDGNLAARPGQSLTYNAENQLTQVVSGTLTTTFTYDGDGKRVKQTVAPTTTVFIGNYCEIAISGTQRITTTYYYANGQRVAMRTAAGVTYIHGDHLGSTAVTSGAQSGDIKYFPYGATRSGAVSTTYKFTGQRLDDSTGLYYYGARYYDAALGRFVQADSIVPNPSNPQALNRYSYTLNNPLKYTDPTGHMVAEDSVGGCDEPPPSPYDPNESFWQAVGLGIEWFFNIKPRVREFGLGDSLTQDIMHDPGMDAFHKAWAEAGYPLPFKWQHTRDEREEGSDFVRFVKAIPVYFREHVVKMTLVSLGKRDQTPEGQLDAVGGTIGSLDEIRVYDAGNGMVTVEVYNEMNWQSLIRTPGSSKSIVALKVPWTGQTIDYFLRHYVGGSTDHIQYFRWQEPRP